MALDLNNLPDKGTPKLNLSALPDKAPQQQPAQPAPMLDRVASGINRLTAPIGKAVESVTTPLIKTALNIAALPDKAPSLLKPAAEVAAAPAKLALSSLDLLGKGTKALEDVGSLAAEKLPEYGVNPNIAAGVGTLISRAPDIYGTLAGGTSLLKAAGKAASKKAALDAFNKVKVPEINTMAGQAELLPKEAGVAAKPVMKLEQLKAATRQPTGEIFVGHKNGPIQQRYNELLKADRAAAQQFLEEELRKKGFVTKAGEFLSPDQAIAQIEGQGPAAQQGLARELPFPSTQSGITPKPINPEAKGIELSRADIQEINKKGKTNVQVPGEQLNLFSKEVPRGKPTQPFKMPVTSPLLPGADARVKKFATTPITDVSANNPLTSRVEMNKRLGSLEATAYQQYKVMGEQANKAEASTNKIRSTTMPGFKANTIDSETLFNYIESPNKIQFLDELNKIDPSLATRVRAVEPGARRVYDDLLNQVNRVRAVNNEAPIARRENYITHFKELSVLDNVGQLAKAGTPEGDKLASEILKSSNELANNAKYAHLKDITFRYVRRKLSPDFEKDAVGALDKYAKSANRYIHMQPVVNELHASADALEKSAPNAANYIRDQADFLAGKPEFIDQGIEKLFGKEGVKLVHTISQRAKSNILLGNASTVLRQSQSLVPTVSDNRLSSVAKAASNLLDDDMEAFALTHSNVLQARAVEAEGRNIGAGPVGKGLNNLLSQADYQFAKLAWFSKFNDSLASGKPLEMAVKDAEEFAAMSQGHTSLVNTPPILRSKLSQELLAFQNQALANARFISTHLWKGKTTPEVMAAATKLGVTFYALQQLEEEVLGKSRENATDYIPLVSAATRGLTGPGLSVLIDPLKTGSPESFARALIKSAFLVQNKIPAGLAVGKAVSNAVLGAPDNTPR